LPNQIPPRGEALNPEHWYTSPLSIPPWPNGRASIQARQGDVFDKVPSVFIAERPLRVARDWQNPKSGRWTYHAHSEDEQPRKLYDWETGEDVVVRATRGLAVLLTQDCELEKPRSKLTFALVRLLDHSIPLEAVETWRRRERYRIFYLGEQDEEPRFGPAYVDFGRLTTVNLEALRLEDRLLSMTDYVRDALCEDFIAYLTLEREE